MSGKVFDGRPVLPPGYSLDNELGRPTQSGGEFYGANYYSDIAGKAESLGISCKDRMLVELGNQMAELILQIPYNDDRFYKVQAKAKEIEKYIKELVKPIDEFIVFDDDETDPEELAMREWYGLDHDREIIISCARLTRNLEEIIGLSLHLWKTRKQERSPKYEKMIKEVLASVGVSESDLTIKKRDRDWRSGAISRKEYFLNDGTLFRYQLEHSHVESNDRGYRDDFYLQDAKKGEEILKKIKGRYFKEIKRKKEE